MNYINAEAAAKKWGLSLRRVQDICKLGKVPGAKHLGKSWLIPEDAEKPADGRRKEVKENLHHYRPLIRKTPFLTMTNLYTVPGSAEEVAKRFNDLLDTFNNDPYYTADPANKRIPDGEDVASEMLNDKFYKAYFYQRGEKTKRVMLSIHEYEGKYYVGENYHHHTKK